MRDEEKTTTTETTVEKTPATPLPDSREEHRVPVVEEQVVEKTTETTVEK